VNSENSSAEETAKYISGMARELRELAVKSDLGFLAYLLSMVEQEAEQTGGAKPPRRRSGLT
jgi:hypothetical protein